MGSVRNNTTCVYYPGTNTVAGCDPDLRIRAECRRDMAITGGSNNGEFGRHLLNAKAKSESVYCPGTKTPIGRDPDPNVRLAMLRDAPNTGASGYVEGNKHHSGRRPAKAEDVYYAGQRVGRDPDANVRLMMLRDAGSR
jgi:hypothetical protein